MHTCRLSIVSTRDVGANIVRNNYFMSLYLLDMLRPERWPLIAYRKGLHSHMKLIQNLTKYVLPADSLHSYTTRGNREHGAAEVS